METTRHLDQELSSYLDGELDAAAQERVEAHVRACSECGERLDELKSVIASARALESRAPEQDLWPGIEQRLGEKEVVPPIIELTTARRRVTMPRFSFSLPQLVAAAAAIAVFSGGFVWWAQREAITRNGGMLPMPGAGGAEASAADFQIHQYDQAVADLKRVLDDNRKRLDPVTVKTVEANLATIDEAIMQARRALLADPSNPYLSGHLADQMKRKIRVLQQAADAVTVDYSGGSS